MKRIALAVVLFVSMAAPSWAGVDECKAAYEVAFQCNTVHRNALNTKYFFSQPLCMCKNLCKFPLPLSPSASEPIPLQFFVPQSDSSRADGRRLRLKISPRLN